MKWPVNSLIRDYTGDPNNSNTWVQTGTTTTYIGESVSGVSMENTWFGAAGVGCGTGGPRGIRGEVMFGYHGQRKIDGTPQTFTYTNRITPPTTPPVTRTPDVYDDPLHTSVTSDTMMFNAYKDLGTWNNVTPYVGAGVGIAYNMVDEVYFTENANLLNKIHGDRDISLAWSLMAGVGIQVSSRAVLDVGYRYMDFGKATSERHDSAGYINPRVRIDDMAAHEIKVGLRYSFGAGDCCAAPAPAYAPMK